MGCGLGNTVGSGRVVVAGHDCTGPDICAESDDTVIVRSNYEFIELGALGGPFENVLKKRLS